MRQDADARFGRAKRSAETVVLPARVPWQSVSLNSNRGRDLLLVSPDKCLLIIRMEMGRVW